MANGGILGLFSDVYTTLAGTNCVLGEVREGPQGSLFRLVKQMGATASAAGEWAHFASSGTYGEVSRSAATALINAVSTVAVPAGVFQSALASGSFGWLQTKGLGLKDLTTDGGVAAGDPLVIDGGATAVGATDTMADGEEESVCGTALAADTSTTQTAGTYTINCEKFW